MEQPKIQIPRILLWLDDVREPINNLHTYLDDVVWVKNYDEFTAWIHYHGLPHMISFDHDLGKATEIELRRISNLSKKEIRKLKIEERTGYDCAQWLVNYCNEHEFGLPYWTVHSMNPVGKKRIENLLTDYI